MDWRNELERIMEEDSYEQHVAKVDQMALDRRLNPQDYPSDDEPDQPQETGQKPVGPLDKKLVKMIVLMKMGKSSKPCAICLQLFACDEIIMRLPCNHIFHKPCLEAWLAKQGSCPNCRLDLKSHFDAQNRTAAPQLSAHQKPPGRNPYL